MIAHVLLLALPFFASPKFDADYEGQVNTIMSKNGKIIQREGLLLVGQGGAMMHDVQGLHLHYLGRRRVDVETARKIYVTSIQHLLTEINTSKTLRPFLHEYPFPQSRLRVLMQYYNLPRGNDGTSIYLVSNVGDLIFYTMRDTATQEHTNVHVETYEEALKAVGN